MKRYPTLKQSGEVARYLKGIEIAKRQNYRVINHLTVIGDAPKAMVRYYEYGRGRRANLRNWPLHIAKVGHKWYPNESITEYMLTRIGESLGVAVAKGRLMIINGQLRYLSEFFLKRNQELVHGADVFAAILGERDFVEQIEKQNSSRELLTIEFATSCFDKLFGHDAKIVTRGFVEMLLFDALVGNNDRHFYNWGFIRKTSLPRTTTFSPVYDTARALFWNVDSSKISSLSNKPKEMESYLSKYVKNARPKTGIDGFRDPNHFDLVRRIYDKEIGLGKSEILAFFSKERLSIVLEMLEADFITHISAERMKIICKCLTMRREMVVSLLK